MNLTPHGSSPDSARRTHLKRGSRLAYPALRSLGTIVRRRGPRDLARRDGTSGCSSPPCPHSRKQVARLWRGTCVRMPRPASVAVAGPLTNSGFQTCIRHSSGPAGSTQSAPRELRDRCRQSLIDSKIESTGERCLPRHRGLHWCRSKDADKNPADGISCPPSPSRPPPIAHCGSVPTADSRGARLATPARWQAQTT